MEAVLLDYARNVPLPGRVIFLGCFWFRTLPDTQHNLQKRQ